MDNETNLKPRHPILKNYFNAQAEAQNYTLAQAEQQLAKVKQAEADRVQAQAKAKVRRAELIANKESAPAANDAIISAIAEAELKGVDYDGPPLILIEAIDQQIAIQDAILEKLAAQPTGIDKLQNAYDVVAYLQKGACLLEIERRGWSLTAQHIPLSAVADITLGRLAEIAVLASKTRNTRITVADLVQRLGELDNESAVKIVEQALDNARKQGGGYA